MLTKKITELLRNRDFICVATCSLDGRPNAAPKFFLKIEENFIYLVDYTIGTTWENLKVNPLASVSFIDTDTLKGYRMNGKVEIIDKGSDFDKILKELRQKEISLSTKRVIEGVYRGKPHESFEVTMSDKFVVLKIKIEEVSETGTRGQVKKEKL
jgi:predicted pyridoxine 5'-phosphate oxidase superfamily flavin-nucleotide-binding protein